MHEIVMHLHSNRNANALLSAMVEGYIEERRDARPPQGILEGANSGFFLSLRGVVWIKNLENLNRFLK
jgi:hypothetical protein